MNISFNLYIRLSNIADITFRSLEIYISPEISFFLCFIKLEIYINLVNGSSETAGKTVSFVEVDYVTNFILVLKLHTRCRCNSSFYFVVIIIIIGTRQS